MEFSELFHEFIEESRVHVETLDECLLALERQGFQESVLQRALRALHTMKGNSAMMGFEGVKHYVHKVEDALKEAIEQKRFEQIVDVISESSNTLRDVIQQLESSPEVEPDLTEATSRLLRILSRDASEQCIAAVEMDGFVTSKTDTIRVDFSRLDELLNLVGELVIYRTRLNQIEAALRGSITDKFLAKELKDVLDVLGKTVSSLQEGIMRVRMLPVRHVFRRFPRMVRDLARCQGKDIELIFEGEDTELDKTVIDELGEPLLHLLRNAVDHGIEPVQERIKKGKPAKGRILLSAAQESNFVVIKVVDDGRGLDIEKIRKRAIELGLISPESSVAEDELWSFIFTPGFSTKEEVSEVSGRGVGLDVVSRNISKLNGHILVESTPEHGTTFTIKLPLSLAIIPALMAEVGDEIYAIPMNAVDETVKISQEQIHYINHKEVIRFRDRVLPVVRLERFFNITSRSQSWFYLVILNKADRKVAITVDRVVGQQEIVIKPLDETLGKVNGIVGASILGDGRIVLIIDVSAFFQWKEALNV